MATFDVAVIGAGPAGAAAALHCTRRGLTTLLLDRATFPRPKTCGDALSNLAISELSDLGVGGRLESGSSQVNTAAAFFPNGYSVRRSYAAEPGCVIPRLKLDTLIVDAARAGGATLLEAAQVTQIELPSSVPGGGTPNVHYKRGGRPHTARARAVIAADGPGSVAWKALGLGRAPRIARAVAATAYFEGVQAAEPGLSEHHFSKHLPCGYFWVFPAVEGEANVGVYQRLDRFDASGPRLPQLLTDFIAQHPGFPTAKAASPTHSWQLPLSSFSLPPAGAGVLCCGDAAHSVDALTGEGIYQALYGARLAANVVADALERDGAVSLTVARRYQRRLARAIHFPQAGRRAIQQALVGVVDWDLADYGWMQRLLELGYGDGKLEITKRVSRGAQ